MEQPSSSNKRIAKRMTYSEADMQKEAMIVFDKRLKSLMKHEKIPTRKSYTFINFIDFEGDKLYRHIVENPIVKVHGFIRVHNYEYNMVIELVNGERKILSVCYTGKRYLTQLGKKTDWKHDFGYSNVFDIERDKMFRIDKKHKNIYVYNENSIIIYNTDVHCSPMIHRDTDIFLRVKSFHLPKFEFTFASRNVDGENKWFIDFNPDMRCGDFHEIDDKFNDSFDKDRKILTLLNTVNLYSVGIDIIFENIIIPAYTAYKYFHYPPDSDEEKHHLKDGKYYDLDTENFVSTFRHAISNIIHSSLINEANVIDNVVNILRSERIITGMIPLPILILRAVVFEHTLLCLRKSTQ